MRPEETRAFAEAKEIQLEDEDAVRYWAERLRATPDEIAEAVGKVGRNRTAVEIYLGGPAPEA